MSMRLLVLGVLLSLLVGMMAGQEKRRTEGQIQRVLPDRSTQMLVEPEKKDVEFEAHAAIFDAVQRGIAEGSVAAFSRYVGPQIYMSLRGAESGYYSANQAFYILQNYLGSRRPQSFRFTTYGTSEIAPYATGPGRFDARGSVESVQVYIALTKIKDRWVISQINIY